MSLCLLYSCGGINCFLFIHCLSVPISLALIAIALRCKKSADFSVAKCIYNLSVLSDAGLVILCMSSSSHSSCVYPNSSTRNSNMAHTNTSSCVMLGPKCLLKSLLVIGPKPMIFRAALVMSAFVRSDISFIFCRMVLCCVMFSMCSFVVVAPFSI